MFARADTRFSGEPKSPATKLWEIPITILGRVVLRHIGVFTIAQSLPRRLKPTLELKDKRLQRWPEARVLGAEAVMWRVWIGHQLTEWRFKAGSHGRGMRQRRASAKSGLSQDVISRIETGQRRIEMAELVALATAYGLTPKELGQLFLVPTASAWREVVASRQPDARFQAPPSAIPFRTSR